MRDEDTRKSQKKPSVPSVTLNSFFRKKDPIPEEVERLKDDSCVVVEPTDVEVDMDSVLNQQQPGVVPMVSRKGKTCVLSFNHYCFKILYTLKKRCTLYCSNVCCKRHNLESRFLDTIHYLNRTSCLPNRCYFWPTVNNNVHMVQQSGSSKHSLRPILFFEFTAWTSVTLVQFLACCCNFCMHRVFSKSSKTLNLHLTHEPCSFDNAEQILQRILNGDWIFSLRSRGLNRRRKRAWRD